MATSLGLEEGDATDDEAARVLAERRASALRTLAEALQGEVRHLVKAQQDRADGHRRACRLPGDVEPLLSSEAS